MEMLLPQDMASHFITQYEKHQLGTLRGPLFTDDQMQFLVSGIHNAPLQMIAYFNTVIALVKVQLQAAGKDEYIADALSHFSSIMIALLLELLHVARMTDGERQAAMEFEIQQHPDWIKPEEQPSLKEVFKNLDFPMPDDEIPDK